MLALIGALTVALLRLSKVLDEVLISMPHVGDTILDTEI